MHLCPAGEYILQPVQGALTTEHSALDSAQGEAHIRPRFEPHMEDLKRRGDEPDNGRCVHNNHAALRPCTCHFCAPEVNVVSTKCPLLKLHRFRIAAPTAYKVLNAGGHGGGRNTYLGHPDSAVAGRAGFALSNLWATPYTEGEESAAGDHTPMSVSGRGLPHFTRSDRPIVDCDLVTWHTVGVTHVPRPEDWPVMPVEHAGLMLVPAGFFECNPVLDLPEGNGSGAAHCAKL